MRASGPPYQNREKRNALLNYNLNSYTTTGGSFFQEGRLVLALNAHKQGQFSSFRSAVKTYDMPRTTAQRRDKGIKPRRGSIALNRRLILV